MKAKLMIALMAVVLGISAVVTTLSTANATSCRPGCSWSIQKGCFRCPKL